MVNNEPRWCVAGSPSLTSLILWSIYLVYYFGGVYQVDIVLYRRYLNKYVQEAITNSDGTSAGIAEHLRSFEVKGFLTRHKTEKRRALEDAIKAFDEHRHWPLDIILSHLGVTLSTQ